MSARVSIPRSRLRSSAPTWFSAIITRCCERSRANQLKFNAALLLGALVIVGLSILTALRLADRLVRPVGELVAAAGRIEAGDFSARVPVTKTEDEVQTLATAFNRMTGRLEEQTNALRSANTQLDTRRAFIEAVLSSVTAGVVAVDSGAEDIAPQPLGREFPAEGSGGNRGPGAGLGLARTRRIHARRAVGSQCADRRATAVNERWRSSACATATGRC